MIALYLIESLLKNHVVE